nr:MAG TPA: hypothetical protein [Caudoviricetes sp.]
MLNNISQLPQPGHTNFPLCIPTSLDFSRYSIISPKIFNVPTLFFITQKSNFI